MRVLENVLLGVRVLPGNQTNALGEERERNLAIRIEETFFG